VTTDEKRQQRVQVRIDLEDAQGELNALRVKAARMADALERVSAKLRYNASLEPSGHDFTLEADIKNRLDPRSQSDLSYDEVLRVIEQLKAARQKVVNFTQQEKQLGTSGLTVAS